MRSGQFSFFHKFTAGLLLIALFQVLTSCITDSLKDCPTEERLIYIRILDVLTGEDITATEELENITLYLFNKDRELVRDTVLSLARIRQYIPIDVTGLDVQNGYAIVWANVDETIQMSEISEGTPMEQLSLMLLNDIQHNGFYGCPGDFFFGSERLNFPDCASCDGKSEEIVDVKRKNGKLHLTVRGLSGEESIDNYYFSIQTRASGYTFDGVPIRLNTFLREMGSMTANRDYLTPEPCMMIHSSLTEELTETNSLVIQFMETGISDASPLHRASTQDHAVIEVNRDINGDYIGIYSGKTTNVLMQLLDNGQVQVQVVLTDWNEIHQWTHW